MAITVGDLLPDATLMRLGNAGPEEVALSSIIDGKKVLMFAVPGAYTPTCSDSHMPSFIRNRDALLEKGVDEIVCVAVNDPFVADAWSGSTGAKDAGIIVLADTDASFTKEIGMDFSAPPAGLHNRSSRYAMLVDNGRVKILNVEDSPGVCGITAGDSILAEL